MKELTRFGYNSFITLCLVIVCRCFGWFFGEVELGEDSFYNFISSLNNGSKMERANTLTCVQMLRKQAETSDTYKSVSPQGLHKIFN